VNMEYGTVRRAIRQSQHRRQIRAVVIGLASTAIFAVTIFTLVFPFFAPMFGEAELTVAIERQSNRWVSSMLHAPGGMDVPQRSIPFDSADVIAIPTSSRGFWLATNTFVPNALQRYVYPNATSREGCIGVQITTKSDGSFVFGRRDLGTCKTADPSSTGFSALWFIAASVLIGVFVGTISLRAREPQVS
jgi:hypothetical protein